ncbi:MAG: hypothetical protein ACPG1C_08675 [Alphaproteobacteria bacterium]
MSFGPNFYMWSGRRENYIAEHEFLVTQGRKKITSQFDDVDNLEAEANQYADTLMQSIEGRLPPDRFDDGSIYEQAYEERIVFLLSLMELGNQFRLALIGAMYHQWEKTLRDWLTSRDCIAYWYAGQELPKRIWKSDFSEMHSFLQCAGLVKKSDNLDVLDECRLVVNVFKHGLGDSFEELKERKPEWLDPVNMRNEKAYVDYFDYADHSDLAVSDAVVSEFSEAIIQFWQAIPEYSNVLDEDELPKRFQDAIKKDEKSLGKTK